MDMSLFTSFEGRINRQKWWLGLIALVVVQWILMLILGVVIGGGMMAGGDPANPEISMAALLPLIIVMLVFLWPSLAIYTKRWHDRGKSGWWTLIILIPFIGGIWALVELGFLRGTEGANQFGPDPLGGA